jgi:type II secretory pathway pseudopilin PulG
MLLNTRDHTAHPSGSAMLSILVLLGLVAVVAVISLPALEAANRVQRVNRTIVLLEGVRLGVHDAASDSRAFRTRVSTYPGALSHLTHPITIAQTNSCAVAYTNKGNPNHVNLWQSNGSFAGIAFDAGQPFRTPIGPADDELERDPASAAVGTLEVIIRNVDVRDAILLDALYDEGNGRTSIGAVHGITWDVPSADGITGRVRFKIRIDATC